MMARETASSGGQVKGLVQAQVAALVAGVAMMGHWARAMTACAEDVSASVTGRGDANTSATRACERYLREVAEIPQLFTLRFLSELERIRTRSAADDSAGAAPSDDRAGQPHRRMPWDANA